jgi:hypothetical protein
MSLEIIKQLYDIENLADYAHDASIVKSTFSDFARTEILHSDMQDLTEKDVLEDIYQTALCIVSRGAVGKGDFKNLQSGIQRIRNFIFSESYNIEKAITHASKAAYLSAVIKYDAETIEHYTDPVQVKNWEITLPLNTKLNKLKKSNPEAFFYWYKTFELIKE